MLFKMFNLQRISVTCLTIRFSKMKLYTHSRQRGMTLVEVILIAVFLGVIAVGSTYFFAQTQTTLRSSSQTMECQTIAKQALENVVSIGSRLYGYTINNQDASLQYNPLFIKKSGSSTVDVGDGSYLGRSDVGFPSDMYKDLFENLGVKEKGSADYNSSNPEKNSGVPIVSLGKDPVELGTPVLITNSVNALQYLYNSNKNFFTGNGGKGEKYTSSSMSDDLMSKALSKYENRFNLEDAELYIKIAPVDLKTDKVMSAYSDIECYKTAYDGTKLVPRSYGCPKNSSGHTLVFTRPRLLLPSDANLKKQMTEGLVLVGNEDIGFEIKVKLKYEQNNQEFSCDAMHRFDHQGKTVTGNLAANNPLTVYVHSLESGAGKNFLASVTPPDKELKLTSCDTHGSGYKNIHLELRFRNFKRRESGGEEFGTLLLCKGKTACRSDGDEGYENCSVQETKWQRCHELEFPEQAGSTDADLSEDDKLKLTFNDLKENRRYDLSIKEVSMLEWSKRSVELYPNDNKALIGIGGIETIRFYIDARRPEVVKYGIPGDEVGKPTDGYGGRNYKGPKTDWIPPVGSLTDKWLQCNTDHVTIEAEITDQFTHNLEPCVYSGTRKRSDKDGKIKEVELEEPIESDFKSDYDSKSHKCFGTVKSIAHGRHTIEAKPHDTCGSDDDHKRNVIWDTDLPKTFEAQSVNDKWFSHTAKVPYTIITKIPFNSKTPEGKFPKHYSVTCFEKEYGDANLRTDGNSGQIACKFLNGNSDRDDGCNPETYGIQYHHVCGASGCKDSKKWGVYVPLKSECTGPSCKCTNVQCEPGLICCDGFNNNDCGSVAKHECEENKYLTGDPNQYCSNPKGGDRSAQDALSGCPPLGLYKCDYELPCGSPIDPFDPGDRPTDPCKNKRRGNTCEFKRDYNCELQGSGIRNTAGDFPGWCNGQSSVPCSIPDQCSNTIPVPETRTRCGNPPGTPPQYVNGVCQNEETYVVNVSRCNQWKATSSTCSPIFTGRCGEPKGSCSPLDEGGGNLSAEKCDVRPPDDLCPIIIPIPRPECDTSTLHGCKPSGSTVVEKGESSPDRHSDLWKCKNAEGFISGQCVKKKRVGDCGDNIHTCTPSGSIAKEEKEDESYWYWKCTSPDDNTLVTSEQCSANRECGTSKHTCKSATVTKKPGNSCSWEWECTGPDDDDLIVSTQCILGKRKGKCGTNENTCTPSGSIVDDKGQDENYWYWKCTSPDDNSCINSDQCSKKKICDPTQECCEGDTNPPNLNCPQKLCGNSKDTCVSPAVRKSMSPTTCQGPDSYCWKCDLGDQEETCVEVTSETECGLCGVGSVECAGYGGPNKESCCSKGTFHHHPKDESTEWKWICKNTPYKHDVKCGSDKKSNHRDDCSEPRSMECGRCGPYKGNSDASCSSGKFHPHPPDTKTEYKWTCINDPHVASDICAEGPNDTDKRQASCDPAPKPSCLPPGEYLMYQKIRDCNIILSVAGDTLKDQDKHNPDSHSGMYYEFAREELCNNAPPIETFVECITDESQTTSYNEVKDASCCQGTSTWIDRRVVSGKSTYYFTRSAKYSYIPIAVPEDSRSAPVLSPGSSWCNRLSDLCEDWHQRNKLCYNGPAEWEAHIEIHKVCPAQAPPIGTDTEPPSEECNLEINVDCVD